MDGDWGLVKLDILKAFDNVWQHSMAENTMAFQLGNASRTRRGPSLLLQLQYLQTLFSMGDLLHLHHWGNLAQEKLK